MSASTTFVVATIGRPGLAATLASIDTRPNDEIIIVAETQVLNSLDIIALASKSLVRLISCPRGNDWGHSERNYVQQHVPLRTDYVAHIDDDDVYAPGMRGLLDSLEPMRLPHFIPRPVMFRMRYANGTTLWADRELRCGNVGTPMFVVPNVAWRQGTWEPYVGGDFAHLMNSGWTSEDFIWREEVLALLRPTA